MAHIRNIVRWGVVAVAVLHGLIHLLGASKGFGWSEVSALQKPIGTVTGIVWLAAAILMIATGLLLATSAWRWWLVGAVAVVVSQAAIVTSWSDAKVGTVANVLLLAAVVYGAAAHGPTSFDAEYKRRVSVALVPVVAETVVTEDDLASLPGPIAAYVRQSGAIGQPHVANFRATIFGRIRSSPTKAWMTFTGEQVNTFGPNPSRSFHMDATMAGLPVDVLHIYANAEAAMLVKLFSLFPMVNANGPEMDRAETVTVFNDLVVLAPGAIISAPIVWTIVDERHVNGTYTNGTQAVTGELTFNEQHELVNFISNDRNAVSSDGKTFTPQAWSTPISSYRTSHGHRFPAVAEARWHAPPPIGEFVYIEFKLRDLEYNVDTSSGVPNRVSGDASRQQTAS